MLDGKRSAGTEAALQLDGPRYRIAGTGRKVKAMIYLYELIQALQGFVWSD